MEKIERDGFVFYNSFYDAIKSLDDPNIKWKIVEAICEYGLNGNEIELDAISRMAFNLVKPQLDANNKRYINGKKGGNPNLVKGQPNPYYKDNQKITKTLPRDNQEITKTLPKDKVKEKDKEKEKVKDIIIKENKDTLLKEKKITRFVKPSVNDIENYLKEKKWDDVIDAEMFWDYYESKGWKVGNTPMKDWKACCRTWINKRNQTQPLPTPIRKDKVCEENNELTEEEILEMMGGI